MKTVVIDITTEYERALEDAKRLINDGQVVGIPTETVYGLAANALNEDAVKKIFMAKGRPSDNPLIVHIAKFDDLEPLVAEIPEKVKIMADKFWPAPLTMIMKKSDKVSNVVSGNLDTVAVRMPKSDHARAIIEACGCPLAAPSANLSGSPSPTNAKYVFDDMNGRIPLIIDGGNCEIGVESTVISFAEEPPRLLRPGGVTLEEMTELIGEIIVDDAVLNKLEEGAVASSPGMKYKHYAPSADITMIKSDFDTFKNLCESENDITALCFDGENEKLSCNSVTYGNENDGFSQSARLFDALRELDEMGAQKVYARCPETKGMGLAVYNRLIRAAGFKIKVI
ncbi:MAG: threonylcarbamoyl-AMP synthase [Clostridia bacterium]|nr:threonylcarbamoyl-AMP synthase [Clostridia bacterium]